MKQLIEKSKDKTYKFLRWTEKWTKTDMVYLAKGGFWLTSSQMITSILGLILTIILANKLPKEVYGTYKYVLSFLGIIALPSISGMGSAIAQSVAKGKEGSFIPAIKTKIKWGTLSTVLSFIFAIYYYTNDNYILASSFALLGIFTPFMESFGLYSNFLHGKKMFGNMSRYDVYSYLISVSIVGITTFFSNSVLILLMSYFGSWTLVRFIFLQITIKKFQPNKEKDEKMVNYGWHLSGMRVVDTISSSLDKILLWHFLGPIQVATYSLAISIPTHLIDFTKIFNRLAFPKLAEQEESSLKKILFPKILKLFLITLVSFILYILIAPLLYKIFFPQYKEAIFYSQIFGIAILTQPLTLIATSFTAQAKTKKLYWVNTLSPIFYIILCLLLIPTLGIIGAIMAFLGLKIFKSVLLIYFFVKTSEK
ncbi:hypothetical protein A2442_00555 [Candidatus Campbellbacteria bacterium RIFOXYC2_FULL_35_25]|uniref:Polysaccharide biosynthesis protein C-terminal domain-containing protein n=1 Tax=Candidatus Campbellbacteria bacterium RIFOXYC2_FULL_35_25 TaxID=1797582 RepID=A0A1F5EIJ0_9BACT|nr:MAG: hypothetical protein A2442_00555 [Candidatus Campbellbacteria bacterium RIFOXYC2_FULL_35_25]